MAEAPFVSCFLTIGESVGGVCTVAENEGKEELAD